MKKNDTSQGYKPTTKSAVEVQQTPITTATILQEKRP
jgi:hypothetical protein